MLTRRQFVATSITAGCSCGFPRLLLSAERVAQRTEGPLGHIKATVGCMVKRTDFQRKKLGELGIGGHVSSFKVGRERYTVSASSGNRLFDRALVEALYQMSLTFDVLPTFGFIKGGNVANAFATTALYKAEPGDADLPTRDDGTVLFGDGMLDFMKQSGIENPVAAVLAICAHEFGHIVQYRYSFDNRPVIEILQEGQPTVKRSELHADFLAGYYVGVAKRRNPETPAASIAQAAYAIGDFQVEDRSHHGTPKERGAAVYEGYRHSFEMNRPFNQALVDGLVYVGAVSG